MNIIEIVKRLPWPEGAVACYQELADGECAILSYRNSSQVIKVKVADIAEDHEFEVVTRGEWIAAKEPVEKKERELGFYWVRVDDEWSVSEFDGEYWDLIGDDCAYTDIAFDEIDERRLRKPQS